MTRRVIIVQARTTSSRLPRKVLADIEGRPMLRRQLDRLRLCRNADEIVVATTVNAADDAIVALARESGVRWFRGDELDVLGRYAAAAREAHAGVIVRITADCPLSDPGLVDGVIARMTSEPACDYASNVLRRTYPRGLDAEGLHRDVLDRTLRLARSHESREHVTWFMREEHPELFVLASIEDTVDNSDLRWTVDTPADLEHVRALYRGMGLAERHCRYPEMLAFARALSAGEARTTAE